MAAAGGDFTIANEEFLNTQDKPDKNNVRTDPKDFTFSINKGFTGVTGDAVRYSALNTYTASTSVTTEYTVGTITEHCFFKSFCHSVAIRGGTVTSTCRFKIQIDRAGGTIWLSEIMLTNTGKEMTIHASGDDILLQPGDVITLEATVPHIGGPSVDHFGIINVQNFSGQSSKFS